MHRQIRVCIRYQAASGSGPHELAALLRRVLPVRRVLYAAFGQKPSPRGLFPIE